MIERRAHRDFLLRGEIHESEIDRDSKVMPASGCDVAVTEEIAAVRAGRPCNHRLACANRTIRVEDLEQISLCPQVLTHHRESSSSLGAKECAVGFVSRKFFPREVVRR